jgi:hypothetical protein
MKIVWKWNESEIEVVKVKRKWKPYFINFGSLKQILTARLILKVDNYFKVQMCKIWKNQSIVVLDQLTQTQCKLNQNWLKNSIQTE